MTSRRNRSRVLCVVALVGLTLVPVALGDSWALPTKERYCSIGKTYCVDIDPKPIESQLKYFKDHVGGAENPRAGEGERRTARATLLRKTSTGSYETIRTFPLLNEVAPVEALVSIDGKYLVTFDNWHSVGWGDDVVVIYRADGSIVKQYSLTELLTEETVRHLPRSVSSIRWGGSHYLDRSRGDVVLQVASPGTEIFDENAKYTELRLDLATGSKVIEKHDGIDAEWIAIGGTIVGVGLIIGALLLRSRGRARNRHVA